MPPYRAIKLMWHHSLFVSGESLCPARPCSLLLGNLRPGFPRLRQRDGSQHRLLPAGAKVLRPRDGGRLILMDFPHGRFDLLARLALVHPVHLVLNPRMGAWIEPPGPAADLHVSWLPRGSRRRTPGPPGGSRGPW